MPFELRLRGSVDVKDLTCRRMHKDLHPTFILTWRFMGTYNPTYKSTYITCLRDLGGL